MLARLRLQIDCKALSGPGESLEMATMSRKLVRIFLGRTTDASEPKGLGGFVSYLKKKRRVAIVDITGLPPHSLIITVECSSLQKLEKLWRDYSMEYLNEMLHKFILEELALTKVKLTTTISEEEYKDCRAHFLRNLGEYDSHFNLFF